MKILILGGDGYLGWPTAMHLSSVGHEVMVVDNYLRRSLVIQEDAAFLFDVPNLVQRVRLWKKLSGIEILCMIGDLRKWDFLTNVFNTFTPDVIIHYAEQPSAPFSMLDRRAAMLTVRNNLDVTANVIFAIKEFAPNSHMIKLGTMGEYGTPNIDIEEGWLTVRHKGREDRFLFPRQAGSLYHTTKIMDTDLLWFYVRMWNLRVTDLMQGPVYGLKTHENEPDERLYPFFNYDEIFGTIINRFVVQAVSGFPLTVFGSGEQTRGYLNIKDTLQCVRIAVENPAEKGELRIFNQFVEMFSVARIAELVKEAGSLLKLDIKIEPVDNPRKEAESHYYNPNHSKLFEMGLKPNYLTPDVLADMMETVVKYRTNIRKDVILKGITWEKG